MIVKLHAITIVKCKQARCAKVQAGESLEPTAPRPARPSSRSPSPEKALAEPVHRDLKLGSIKKVARQTDAEPLAPINPQTWHLSDLHPHPVPSRAPPPAGPPSLVLTQKVLKKVMKRVPRGSTAGPSGATLEHLKATLQGSRSCRDRTIEFFNKVLSGEAPIMPEMLARRVVALQRRKGGVRRIAVGEVWMRFCHLWALEI